MRRSLDDVSVELKGIAATLDIMSGAYLNDDMVVNSDSSADSTYFLSNRINQISDEIAELALLPNRADLAELSCEAKSTFFKKLRMKRGLSQEELSEMTGIPCSTIKDIEDGKEVIINTHDVVTLADTLDAKPSEMFA